MRALIIFLGLALLQIYQVTAFTHTLSVFMQCRCKTLTLTTMEQHEQGCHTDFKQPTSHNSSNSWPTCNDKRI